MGAEIIYRTARQYIKATPFLYSKLARNLSDEAVHTTSSTELVIEGFQRSGNTYCWFLIREMLKHELNLAHHTHSVSSLKVAAKKYLPTIVIIRSPLDSIISASIYRTGGNMSEGLKTEIEYMIDDYYSFYKFLASIKLNENILINDFSSLINSPEVFCQNVINKFQAEISFKSFSSLDFPKVLQKHASYENSKNSKLHMSTQQNALKNSLKPKISDFIAYNFGQEIDRLNTLYEKVSCG